MEKKEVIEIKIPEGKFCGGCGSCKHYDPYVTGLYRCPKEGLVHPPKDPCPSYEAA